MDNPNPLLGAWRLVRWDITYGDGRAPTLPYGEAATGLILYSTDGWMNACIARAGRARLSSDSVRSAPETERLAAFESYFQYAGRYAIRGEPGRQQVVHSVTQSLNPNFVGSEQVRDMHFDADGRLTLSASDTVPGTSVARHHRLMWERVPSGGEAMNAVLNAPAELGPFERHRATFERAALACRERHCWSPYPELPSKYPDAAQAQAVGAAAFRAHLNSRFALDQPGAVAEVSEEVSPYTQKPLGIRYPQADIDTLFDAAGAAIGTWAAAPIDTRIGVLMDVLDAIYREHLFEIAQSVMHTAGQSFNMAYAGSGVNALDRGIEALVHARQAMDAVAPRARWERAFGSARIVLDKTYRLVPRGVAVCFSCASFPTWNAWPSMLASLATGNAVIVKPHPATVLPMAISVRVFRRVLAAAGFAPNLVTLALDTSAAPIGKRLVQHPKTAIVDFTGSVAFGQWVERNAHPALVFTETAGCNTVVLESADDLGAALRSLATTLCMFSAQMCTSPQNIYVPAEGVRTPQGLVPLDEVGRRLADAVAALTSDPKKAAMILATLQSPQTLALLERLMKDGEAQGEVLLRPASYAHPEFPAARTSTPLMLKVGKDQRSLYGEERFGPVSFVIACDDAADALAQATGDVREFGGLTAFLYSTDERYIERAEAAYASAGAQLTINLTGPMPLNFAAAYSDYHVTGLNPAGNASLTDLAFVAGRFRISQSRRPAADAHPTPSTS